jgi:hypothetical protein
MANEIQKLKIAQDIKKNLSETEIANFELKQTISPYPGFDRSPHLINLKPTKNSLTKSVNDETSNRRRLPIKWKLLLDERVHLKDLRYRTVSIKPRGWRDLPPKEAKTLWEAVSLTIQKFFAEHPLAELTVLALAQTIFVLSWKLLVLPFNIFSRIEAEEKILPEKEEKRVEKKETVLPIAAVIATADKKARTSLLLYALNIVKQHSAWAYATIALILLLPFGAYTSFSILSQTKDSVITRGLNAIGYLKVAGEAAQAKNFAEAETAFGLADQEFKRVKEELGALTGILTTAGTIVPSSKVSGAGLMLTAGESLAEGGKYVAAGLAALKTDASPADRLRGLNANVSRALPHLKRASRAISLTTADALPEEYRDTLDLAKAELPKLLTSIEEVSNMAEFLALIMGSEEPRRYLLAFQNVAEMRPTGGFIGSFALLDINQGQISNLEIPGGGSYDLQGNLMAKVAAPKPLRLINPRWEFQDANWSPDFPTSAQQLIWFYEKSGGPTVDGVIAINSTVIEKLLAVIGPVEMASYSLTLDAENFTRETQRAVEIDFDREKNQPKQILTDLAPLLLARITSANRDNYIQLAKILETSLAVKDIQLWFAQPEMQNQASKFGWAGETKSAPGDYLQIIHTNIAGQKTDAVMAEDVSHEVKILADGSTIVTLIIKRTHQGIKGELFNGVRNVDYLRIYVPLGSSLIEAEGFRIPDPKLFQIPDVGYDQDPVIAKREEYEVIDRRSGTRTSVENGKTVFANWVQTDPGETSEVKFVYQLPLEVIKFQNPNTGKLTSMYARLTGSSSGKQINYSLFVQKQSGTNPIGFTSSVDLPRGFHTVQEFPTYETDERNRELTTTTLNSDFLFQISAESPWFN